MRHLLLAWFLLIALVVLPSPSLAAGGWVPSGILIDLQGDNTHGGYDPGTGYWRPQAGPVDYVFPNGETGNYCGMKAMDASGGKETTPKSWTLTPNNHAAIAGATATLTMLGTDEIVGYAGRYASPQTLDGLNTDSMAILPAGNSYGTITDGMYDFELTGLLPATKYRLGLISSENYNAVGGLSFSLNGGAVTRDLPNPNLTNTVVTVQSDATGKITGTVSLLAGRTEGNWGGLSVNLAPPDVIRQ